MDPHGAATHCRTLKCSSGYPSFSVASHGAVKSTTGRRHVGNEERKKKKIFCSTKSTDDLDAGGMMTGDVVLEVDGQYVRGRPPAQVRLASLSKIRNDLFLHQGSRIY